MLSALKILVEMAVRVVRLAEIDYKNFAPRIVHYL
jgi:hypothetical protein